jgi:hypothetical protein
MKPKKPTLAEVQEAVMKLLLLPDGDNALTEADKEFLRSDLVGELLNLPLPAGFSWESLKSKIYLARN